MMENEKNKKENKILDRIITAVLILSIIFFILSRVFALSRVSGSSMSPTYIDKEYIICNQFVRTKDYKRGDVITFYSGKIIFSDIYIKRIVALPGDTVQIKDGLLYINGEAQKTVLPVMENSGIAEEKIVLQEDEFFVLGDNRNYSKDSRIIGPVKANKIIGRVIW